MSDAAELLATARAAYDANDWSAQERLARKIIQIAQASQDTRTQARGFHHLGIALYHRDAADDARAAYQRALALFVELGDERSAAVIRMSLGSVALDLLADATEARKFYDLALPVLRTAGDDERLGQCLGNLAEIARLEGDYDLAVSCALDAVPLLSRSGDTDRVGWQYVTIAHCRTLQRQYSQAFAALASAYESIAKNGNARWLATYFDAWIMLAVHLRKWETAAELTGFLERYRHEQNVPRLPGVSAWYKVSVEQIERRLKDGRSFELRMSGADLSPAQAQALAAAIANPGA